MANNEPKPQEMVVPANVSLILQGERSRDIFYWKKGGRVRILVEGKSIRELEFDRKAPYFFGDLAALLDRPRASTVETLTENVFIRIPFSPRRVEMFMEASPELTRRWLVALAREAHDGIEALRERQKTLAELEERRKVDDQRWHADKNKWSGVLFLAQKVWMKTNSAKAHALCKYFEELKIFGLRAGKGSDLDPKRMTQEMRARLF